jgi:hypothetical protein
MLMVDLEKVEPVRCFVDRPVEAGMLAMPGLEELLLIGRL